MRTTSVAHVTAVLAIALAFAACKEDLSARNNEPLPEEDMGPTWSTETARDGELTGFSPSITIDDSGQASIAYYTLGELQVVSKSAGNWDADRLDDVTVPTTISHTTYTAASLAPDGRRRVTYYDFDEGTVNLAVHEGAEWSLFRVVDGGEYHDHTVDTRSRVLISYVGTSGGMRFARSTDTEEPDWIIGDISPGPATFNAATFRGEEHIILFAAAGELKLATSADPKSTGWQIEDVPVDDVDDAPVALDVTPDGTIHVGCFRNGNLLWMKQNADGWEEVGVSPAESSDMAMEIEGDGTAHFLFLHPDDGLTHAFGDGGTWTTRVISDAAESVALTLQFNTPHAAFRSADDELVYGIYE